MVLDPPTSTYLVPSGIDADAVISFLAERLLVEADEPVTVETTVLDTVDRRLRAAGIELLLDRHRGVTRLTLRDQSGRPPLTTDVPPADRPGGPSAAPRPGPGERPGPGAGAGPGDGPPVR